MIRQLDSETDEIKSVADWITEHRKAGVVPHEFGLFVRSAAQLDRAKGAARDAGVPYVILDDSGDGRDGHISISTMHLAKGLEFRAAAVMACDDEVTGFYWVTYGPDSVQEVCTDPLGEEGPTQKYAAIWRVHFTSGLGTSVLFWGYTDYDAVDCDCDCCGGD